jgi:hypothetical protein
MPAKVLILLKKRRYQTGLHFFKFPDFDRLDSVSLYLMYLGLPRTSTRLFVDVYISRRIVIGVVAYGG